jgi:hypothetical protein
MGCHPVRGTRAYARPARRYARRRNRLRSRGGLDARHPERAGVSAWPQALGVALLRRERCPPPEVPFPTKSPALEHYRNVIEPRLRGEPEPPEPEPERTFGEFVLIYLQRHAATVRPRTIETLRKRLGHRRTLEDGEMCRCATCAFGDVPLRELERLSGQIASWQAKLPERSRYGTMQALRQTLEAGAMGPHDRQPRQARGTQSAAAATTDPRLHARRTGGDRGGARSDVPGTPCLRRRDRAAARGVGGARARGRRPPRRDSQDPPHDLRRRDR